MKRYGNKIDHTLFQSWQVCIRMWNEMDLRKCISLEKQNWLCRNGYTEVRQNCFFCEFIPKNEDLRDCPSCPAKQVDKRFHCEGLHVEVEYDWDLHPKAFRRKINRLHKKFLSQR